MLRSIAPAGANEIVFDSVASSAPAGVTLRSVVKPTEVELSRLLPRMERFLSGLTEETIRSRYHGFHPFHDGSCHKTVEKMAVQMRERKMMLCLAEKDGDIVGLGELNEATREDTEEQLRFCLASGKNAEIGIVVASRFQGQQIGNSLMRQFEDLGRQQGFVRILGRTEQENQRINRMFQKHNYIARTPGDRQTIWFKDLDGRVTHTDLWGEGSGECRQQ